MIYVMNSAVMPAGCFGTYQYLPASVDDLAAVLKGEYGPQQPHGTPYGKSKKQCCAPFLGANLARSEQCSKTSG